nr:MFS transporter [Thermoanaerobacterales bacterium]
MTRRRPTASPRAGAVAVVFVANGLGGPSFLPRLPERQASLGLSDAGLGAVLVGLAVGALAASPLAGRAVERFGSRRVVLAAAVGLGGALWTAGAAPTPAALFAALAAIGAADAAMDIAMNANGAAYERRAGRSVMHRLHGAWSLGSLGAAGLAAAAAGLGVPLTVQLAVVGAALAAGVVLVRGGLVADDGAADRAPPAPTRRGPGRSRRPAVGPLVALAVATMGGAVVEGGPSDWSAIRLERLGTGPGVAALGFAAFTAGMLAGRLVGDAVTDRVGGVATLRWGMALAAAGLLVGAVVDHPAPFALGLLVAGVGASGFFPLAFAAAGNTAGVAPGTGAATVSLAARLGFLAEPVIVGAVAELVGLRWAFVLVAATAGALALAAGRVLRPGAGPPPAPTVADLREC